MGDAAQTNIQSFIDHWQASGAAKRAAEEAADHIRWLRPKYQAPDEVQATQTTLLPQVTGTSEVPVTSEPQPRPKLLKERATAVRATLAALDGPADLNTGASAFKGRRTKKRLAEIEEILDMLRMLGQTVGIWFGNWNSRIPTQESKSRK